MMKRNPDHVFQFMMAELGTEGSIDGTQRLVIRGKFVPKVCKCQISYWSIIVIFVVNSTLSLC
jgi:translation initiation factor 2 beta subunit (eIF-2beta)/eIF-5